MNLRLTDQKRLTPPQIVAIGFTVTIFIGALLLKLPISTTQSITFLDALFTATSATTVTGLVVVDTGTSFTMFGQIIIMILMKIGGLGLMSFALLIILILGKRIGLRERILVQESLNQTATGGIVRLVILLLAFSTMMELIATAILAMRWVPEYGWGFGLFTSLFHAVSAFNNAGFSLWGESLSNYVGDPVVNMIITMLFITGGIGFTVIYDLVHKRRFKTLSLHSKLMLVGTFTLNLIVMFLIFLLEFNNQDTLGSLSWSDKLWGSYFQAVTPRTAGFNTLDIASLEPSTLTLIIMLMFIGAGSASTGSGIKLTTILIIIVTVRAYLKGNRDAVVFGRRISESIVIRALSILVISLGFVAVSIFLLSYTEQSADYLSIIFEAFSAFGTVGLSMGLTGELSALGKIIVMILMIVGRVGPVTLAFALAKSTKDQFRYPKEDVFTG
ncbi:TrkH family potassium uptake protein [Exiguobacterium sp. ZOR0005]|uniref:TrkH family potassium uptake protein n=1 Tax=Exiguobacterium sp. ZOR0005 TaxID=1339226 RepID=UPI000645ECD7|nr:TrkH family potassium uptake protein [Exiguobacterium sp. ZOR0005]